MARTKKAAATSEQTTTIINFANEAKSDFRTGLKKLTNVLVEMAKQEGRTDFTANGLLRESYLLAADTELDTFEGWNQKGAQVRKGQHAYLFWGAPTESKSGHRYCPVSFKFSREQVYFKTAEA